MFLKNQDKKNGALQLLNESVNSCIVSFQDYEDFLQEVSVICASFTNIGLNI